MNDRFDVRPAVTNDVTYVDSLQRANAENLSFYPRAVFEREIELGRILLARLNGEPCGYLYFGAFARLAPIHQACIQYDARGRLYGAALVRDFLLLARAHGSTVVGLRCGSDIEANGFWQAMGFQCVRVTKGGGRRLRDINHWVLELESDLIGYRIIMPSARDKNRRAYDRARRKGLSADRMLRGTRTRAFRALVEAELDPP